ncbi:MAG: hypothetical protein AAFY22_13225 [Pseudomonadota bacterium]
MIRDTCHVRPGVKTDGDERIADERFADEYIAFEGIGGRRHVDVYDGV